MGDHDKRCAAAWPLLIALVTLLLVPAAAQTQDLKRQRIDYIDAKQALADKNAQAYQRSRTRLNGYPLAVYLDYLQLTKQPAKITVAAAQRFLVDAENTPLRNRFLAQYLAHLGQAQQWRDFLAVQPEAPVSVNLQCYFYRAQLSRGATARAWEGARGLWQYGRSQPRACDPLFKAWEAAGQLTDSIVWTRLCNAFEARQGALLRYVVKKSSAQLRPWAQRLAAAYSDPSALVQQNLPADNPYAADIVSYGAAYLAQYSPSKALSAWRYYQQQMPFDQAQAYRVEYAIARHSLFSRTTSHQPWLRAALQRLSDDELVGIRLRWALSEQDWTAVAQSLPLLSAAAQEKTVWRYWQARLQQQRGDSKSARMLLQQLATERDYYGFLAADTVGLPYTFNHRQMAMQKGSTVAHLAAVKRIEELKFHAQDTLAHAEWYGLLQATDSRAQLQDLMVLASDKRWYRMAIDAAAQAQAWDALDYRFPTPYVAVFNKHANLQAVPATELMAIARRESAFFAQARSSAGARGLMQVMPATGAAVAASLNIPHNRARLFDVEHNVVLGSAYYRQLLDRFDGNRIFALTGYNAGPNRVRRWRHKEGEQVPVALWVETIPYKETRQYVQAVLSYNVVFQYLSGAPQALFTRDERAARY